MFNSYVTNYPTSQEKEQMCKQEADGGDGVKLAKESKMTK